MKKLGFLLVIFAVLTVLAFAQDNTEEVPPESDVIEVGPGARIVVPEGMKVKKTGSQITIEDLGQYTQRRLKVLEDRLAESNAREEDLRQEIEQMKSALSELQDKLVALQNLQKAKK